MSLGTGHWKLLYYTNETHEITGHILENVKSKLSKKVKYDSTIQTTLDGNRHDIKEWKYITYTILVEGFTASDWTNIYEAIDGQVVTFFEHSDNANSMKCIVESVMPYFKDDQYDKPMIKVVISTQRPTIETLVTATGIDTQSLPSTAKALGSADWFLNVNGDDVDANGSWSLTDYEFNKPSQIINKSVLTGMRRLTRKGTYNSHKIIIQEPTESMVTILLNNVGTECTFYPFTDNMSFSETVILKDVKYYNPEGYYLKNSITFSLISKGFTSITPIV